LTDPSFRIDYRIRALVICVVVPTMCFLARHFNLDDSLIYARYIEHALQGRGLEFNPGEPVNALTSILNTWLVLGASTLLGGRVILAQVFLSGIFLLAANLIAESIVPLSGIFLSIGTFLYFCNGMETSLFLLILILCVNAYLSGRINWLPLLCTLALLTRFEGGAMGAIIAWQLWKSRRFPKLIAYLPCLLLLTFYSFFNLHYYHAWLPQSASAKLVQGMSGFWGKWPTAFLHVWDVVYLPITGSWIYIPLLLLFAWHGAKDPSLTERSKIVVPFLSILAAFYILFNIPPYFWYYAPFVFFLTIYAIRVIPRTKAGYLGFFLIAFCLLDIGASRLHHSGPGSRELGQLGDWMDRHSLGVNDYARMGDWIEHNTSANATVATSETGTIGWHCDRYIIDMVGLTTPQNARYTAHGDYSSWLAERPDYVVVHKLRPFPWETVAVASPDYEYVPVSFGDVFLLRRKPPAP